MSIIPYAPTTTIVSINPALDSLIDRWLASVLHNKSGSAKTHKAYRDTLTDFRATLQRGGLDLDSQDVAMIADVAEIWAEQRSPRSRRAGRVANATYNQRLNILSSFFSFLADEARRRDLPIPRNPLTYIKRRYVDPYSGAEALEADEVAQRLATIDRSTAKGKRDYALLVIGLQTARRANELVTLRMGHLRIRGSQVTIHFEHCKGGKKMRDTLDQATSKIFLEYLKAIYGPRPQDADPQAPVWISFAPMNRGQAIGYHTLANICDIYLESRKTHLLRHTGAAAQHKAGLSANEVKEQLGHSSIAITDRYLKMLKSDENPVASKTAERFGIGSRRTRR